MKPANPRILTINGGSSSIKFALYKVGEPLKRRLYGWRRVGVRDIMRVGIATDHGRLALKQKRAFEDRRASAQVYIE